MRKHAIWEAEAAVPTDGKGRVGSVGCDADHETPPGAHLLKAHVSRRENQLCQRCLRRAGAGHKALTQPLCCEPAPSHGHPAPF